MTKAQIVTELSDRYLRHHRDESDFIAGLMEGWLQALSLVTGKSVNELRKELDDAH